jgi:hypothetical protein
LCLEILYDRVRAHGSMAMFFCTSIVYAEEAKHFFCRCTTFSNGGDRW